MSCKVSLLCSPHLISRYSDSTCVRQPLRHALFRLYCSLSTFVCYFCLGCTAHSVSLTKLLLLLEDPAQVNTEHHCLSLRLSYARQTRTPSASTFNTHAGNILSGPPPWDPHRLEFWAANPLWLLPASQGPAQDLTYRDRWETALSGI